MSSAAPVSLKEYLHRSQKPLCGYINGVPNPKPMPTKLHGLVQDFLVTFLRRQNVEALAEVTGWHDHSGGEPERVEQGGVLKARALSVGLEDLFAEVRGDQ